MLKKCVAVFAIWACLSNLAFAAPCAEDDLDCISRELGKKADEALSLARELESTKGLLELEKQKQAAIQAAYTQLKETLPGLSKAIEAVKPRWYESPWLWLSIGFTLGFIATVVGAVAIGQVAVGLRL